MADFMSHSYAPCCAYGAMQQQCKGRLDRARMGWAAWWRRPGLRVLAVVQSGSPGVRKGARKRSRSPGRTQCPVGVRASNDLGTQVRHSGPMLVHFSFCILRPSELLVARREIVAVRVVGIALRIFEQPVGGGGGVMRVR